MPEIGKTSVWTSLTMFNIFMVTCSLGKFLSRKLYDGIGTGMSFVVSIAIWSVASIFHAVARGLISLTLFRATLN